MAGAIDLFGEHVRGRMRLFARQPAADGGHVGRGLARIYFAQRGVAVGGGADRRRRGNRRRDNGGRLLRSEPFGSRPFPGCPGCRFGRGWRRGVGLGLRRCIAPGSQRMGASHELCGRRAVRGRGADLSDQLRQQFDRRAQRPQNVGRSRQRAVKQPVHEVFHCPGEFTQLAGADHAAASLEGMERAADGGQRGGFQRILVPDRVLRADLFQFFARFFGEQRQQLGVAGRGAHGSRRCGRQHRGRTHAAGAVGIKGRARQRLRGRRNTQRTRVIGRTDRRHCRHYLVGLPPEYLEADLRVVEHVPGIAPSRLQRFDVVLEADHRIGEAIEIGRGQRHATGLHDPA